MGAGNEPSAIDALTAAVAQVRGGDGAVVGAAFLVAGDLLISCAHVLVDGGYGPGDVVPLGFPRVHGAPLVWGRVLEEGWRDPQGQDIALVRLEEAPAGVAPLSLGSVAGCHGHRVRSLGFPQQAPPDGHFGSATAVGVLSAADSAGDLLQLTGANDLTTGFSGGPVLDETTGLVVGMLTAITVPDGHDRGHGIAYATPTEVLRQAWPAPETHDVMPYRGLEPFTAEHAHWFRGRKEAARQVVAALAGGRRVVLLLGPSGAGKSSLVQAGVLPELAAGQLPGSDRWRQVIVRPGLDLPTALEQAGLPDTATTGIGTAVTGLLEADPAHDRVVLVVDQFEELLAPSAGPASKAAAALASITEAIGSDAALSVVLVMRDDFYPRLSALAPALLQAALEAQGVLNVPATLTAEELDAIITGPADELGVAFEGGLAQRIASDVLALTPLTAADFEASVTVLPLLEVALSRLWGRRLHYGGRLTHDAYRRIGGVTGALADWCGAALRELDERQRRIAQRALTALVRPADQGLNIPAARQQLPLDELRDLAADGRGPEALQAVDEVLAVLAGHRVITTDRMGESGQPDDGDGMPTAELIHDTLVRDWDALRRWVEQDARFHDWLHRTRTQRTRWREHQNPQDLLTGTALAEGADWARRRRLPADLEGFLAASRRHQQAAVRRSRRLNVILAISLALALVASAVALWQRQTAIAEQQTALSRQLAAESSTLISTDPDLASLLAVAAYRTSHTNEAVAALATAAGLPLRHRIAGHTGAVTSVAFSPDGHTLATGSDDHTVRLWDTASGTSRATLAGHTGAVTSVAFSPDGRTLATGGDDQTARLWDVASRTIRATLAGHTGAVTSVAFSPDGRTLATGSSDQTARLWDVASRTIRTTRSSYAGGAVTSVAFSPDGRTLAIGDADRTVLLWNIATGTSPAVVTEAGAVTSVVFSPDGRTLAIGSSFGSADLWDTASRTSQDFGRYDDTGAVTSVAFSPDGSTLATSTRGGMVWLWDTAKGSTDRRATLAGHTGAVTSVAFSPDGHTLATGGDDHTARLWETASGTSRAVHTGHNKAVTSVAFSPDGHTLATGGDDHTARLWDLTTGTTRAVLAGNMGAVTLLAFSPDGRTLATNSDDGDVRLWDVTSGTSHAILSGDKAAVFSVAFSPDGHTLATGSDDGDVRLWDVASRTIRATLTGHTNRVTSLAFSPDGRTLATGSFDQTARLWDVASRTIRTTLANDAGEAVFSVAFSPDGQTLATGSYDGGVRLWDTANGTSRAVLAGDRTAVFSLAFSPDGHTLATSSGDPVRLWDTASDTSRAVLHTHTADVYSVAFSPDGRTLATSGDDGDVRLWDVPYATPDTAISTICQAVHRELTPKEQSKYLSGEPNSPVCPS
ncbi:trypsin-like peptidase domain-containing protein [Kitasatospora sp. NPDC096077]|uniref:nSTAND1 domain-containing NTPase n=1 Tax=Kitasatospora sp. NPDC096077 TaxID=3155544 RepID=UPI00332402E0